MNSKKNILLTLKFKGIFYMNISNLQEFYEFTDFLSQRKIEANIDVQSSEKIFNLYTKDQEEIIKAYDLLSDEFSKTNFIRYLQYILLWSLVNENLASKMSNYLDKSLVEPLFEQCVRNFKLDDFVEALNINPNDSIREKCVFVLNNYLFQKYDYQANYGVDGNVDLTVKPGEICLDIGAARGDTVYYFIKQKTASKVYAVEMNKKTFSQLKNNMIKLDISNQVELYNIGIADHEGIVSTGYSSTILCDTVLDNVDKYKAKYNDATVGQSNISTIDNFYKNLKEDSFPTFIKIDIIGSEFKAICGASNTLKNLKPTFAIGIWNIFNLYKIVNHVHEIEKNYDFYFKLIGSNCEPVLFICKKNMYKSNTK